MNNQIEAQPVLRDAILQILPDASITLTMHCLTIFCSNIDDSERLLAELASLQNKIVACLPDDSWIEIYHAESIVPIDFQVWYVPRLIELLANTTLLTPTE